ncbi:MAG: phytanoyl-CoA dioxygenase family protein, partial [Gemmatimonadota bacterium]|nr:phytanoyl-CoA dioxygenase family protein [Gemmatimonadota bacterium]
MTDHPTDAECFFFDNNGYLVLKDFLAPDRVAGLYAALERTIERRRDSQFRREHEPAFADRLDAANVRVMHLLAEDPLFLEMLDYEPMMAYVHGLFNEMPHLHSTDAFYEVEPADYHGRGWHIDGIQDGFRNLKP